MAYSISLLGVLVAVLISSIVHAAPLNDTFCDLHIVEEISCYIRVSFAHGCNSSTLTLDNSKFAKLCSSVSLFWSYPTNNLTTIIETPYTQPRQPFTIHLHSRQLKPQISHIYRLSQGQENERKTIGNTMIERSDSNYQIILKFQAATTLTFQGVFIAYELVKD
jgi:hypothetical protein